MACELEIQGPVTGIMRNKEIEVDWREGRVDESVSFEIWSSFNNEVCVML